MLQLQETGNNLNTSALKYQLVKKVKDNTFDIDYLDHYSLSIQVSYSDFQFCVIDKRKNRCLLLEDFTFESAESTEKLIAILHKIFEEHHLLMAGFWNGVRLSIKNKKFTLVPSPLFKKESASDYLRLNCEFDPQEEDVYFFHHPSVEAINVFAANKNLVHWVKSLYPQKEVQIIHQGSAIIEGQLNKEGHAQNSDAVFLNFDRDSVHVTIQKDKAFKYYNQFPLKTPEQNLKYVLLTFQELNLPHNTRIVIWGNINTRSAYIKELYKYLKNLSFGNKPYYLRYGYMFDEIEDHQYYDVFNLALCQQ
jgi:hypothetical protein